MDYRLQGYNVPELDQTVKHWEATWWDPDAIQPPALPVPWKGSLVRISARAPQGRRNTGVPQDVTVCLEGLPVAHRPA